MNDDGDVRAKGDGEIEVLEDIFLAVRVAEADVAELDIAVDGLPVFLFGREAVAVAVDDRLRVGYVRRRLWRSAKKDALCNCRC